MTETLLTLFSLSLGMGLWTVVCVRIGYRMGRETQGLATVPMLAREDKPAKVEMPDGYDDPWTEAQREGRKVIPTIKEQ